MTFGNPICISRERGSSNSWKRYEEWPADLHGSASKSWSDWLWNFMAPA
jgi:hypothetical protein